MRTLLFAVVLFITSCTKENNNAAIPNDTPRVESYKFFSIRDGGEQRPAFDVTITSNDNVKKLDLVLSPSTIRYSIDNPATGTYRMYDHISIYPTYAQSYFYYFVFELKDGSKIIGNPFQVY